MKCSECAEPSQPPAPPPAPLIPENLDSVLEGLLERDETAEADVTEEIFTLLASVPNPDSAPHAIPTPEDLCEVFNSPDAEKW